MRGELGTSQMMGAEDSPGQTRSREGVVRKGLLFQVRAHMNMNYPFGQFYIVRTV